MTDYLPDRLLWFVLASTGLIVLPHAWHVPLPLFGFFLLPLGWRCVGIGRPDCLPGKWLLFALTVAGLVLLFSQQRGVFGRDAGTGLFVVSLGLKLLEIRGRRDVYVIVFLSFIVAATQFLYEESILMAGYIALVCVLGLATLITLNSRTPRTGAALWSAGRLIAQAVPAALVLFVLFPRLEAPRWSWLQDTDRARSGLSNKLEPGAIAELSLSGDLVFRVKFAGELPPAHLRYWRGPIYAFTDGVVWQQLPYAGRGEGDPTFDSTRIYDYTLLMEPQNQHWVYALDLPYRYPPELRRNGLYQLLADNNPGERAEYRLASAPNYRTGDLDDSGRRENLQLPGKLAPRIQALVERLRDGDADPERFITRLLGYFREQNFRYTLTPPTMPVKPIEAFLFDHRAGFCSHYATAFVYVLRAAGIPARVVGGYQGGQFNAVGGFLEVRQADAHAWAEVWLAERGWVRFDPTAAIAPERIERGVDIDLQVASGAVNFRAANFDPRALSWLQRGAQLWSNIDYQWQRWVINYDNASQREFLSALGIQDWLTLAYWLFASLAGIGGLLAWRLLKPLRRRRDPVAELYRRFVARLVKAGLMAKPGYGPSELADQLRRLRPDLAEPAGRIAETFNRLYFEETGEDVDLSDLKRRIDALR
ncbi:MULTISPECIES: transglutaminase TgpA family protein [Methylomonas]|uniref:Transglutaminase n=1 Tax=Methylomonas koyamae TaxID=702114 RepID=A0A177NU07_9GAMM|nr:DUF3488 and transglutaminase-like domain-containing protein [Methylomonas koyamae]OAI21401.1 transglutaminase [Methylomonas koyamae]